MNAQQKKIVLLAAILASSMAFIDATALNVALPALQKDLGLNGTQLLWVVNAYTLPLASLILIGGSSGDIFGKKKVFLIGIIIFTVFSAFCGFAQSGTALIIFRAFQGLGGALMVPGSLALISASFESAQRGKAIGTWSMYSSLTTIAGPILGGYLAGEGLWRYIFFINIPLGLISFFLLFYKVEEPAKVKDQRLDWVGGLLSVIGLTILTLGFIEASERGFDNIWIWASIIGGILLVYLFIRVEARSKNPMMPLKLFSSSTFSGANAMTLFIYGALGAILFFVPLNLIQIQGYSAQTTGLALLAFVGPIALLARLSGLWTDRVGAKIPLITGPVITGIAFFGFSMVGQTDGFGEYWSSFFPVFLLAGTGMGITVVPLTTAVMNCVTENDTGIASGVNNTIARLANVLALAILGSVALLIFQNNLLSEISPKVNSEQLQYMEAQAVKLAEAMPDESWLDETRAFINNSIQSNFIHAFNITAIISGIMCLIGAIISWIYIKGKPKTVTL